MKHKSVYVLYKFCDDCVNDTIIKLLKESGNSNLVRMHEIKIKRKQKSTKCEHGNGGSTTKAIRVVLEQNEENNESKKSFKQV